MAGLRAKKPSSGSAGWSPPKRQRQLAVQAGIVGIADGRHGGQAVERAAQHDDDEARVARAGRMGAARHEGPGEQRRRPSGRARRDGEWIFAEAWSSPLEFRRHQDHADGLLPRFGAVHRLARFGRGGIARTRLEQRRRVGDRRRTVGQLGARSSRSFRPSGEAQAADESGKPFGPGGSHSGIAERPQAVERRTRRPASAVRAAEGRDRESRRGCASSSSGVVQASGRSIRARADGPQIAVAVRGTPPRSGRPQRPAARRR